MISEDEKGKIYRSLMWTFDTFSHQRYRDLFAGASGEGGAGAAAAENRFLVVRAYDISSYMRVLGRRARSRPAMKHRKVLANAAIRSMAKGCFEMSELGAGPDGDTRSGYTDRHYQRLIHERYGDAFLELEADREPDDGRVRRLSTVFAKSRLPRSSDADAARIYLDAAGAVTLQNGDVQRRLALISILRQAFPQFLSDMLDLREECRAVFENLGERNDRIDFLREQLVEGPGLLDIFYSQLSSILDAVWFRALPEDEQKPLLMPAAEAKYGQEDARKASAMLSGIYGRNMAHDLVNLCGNAFLYFGRPRDAVLVFAECANLAEGDMRRGSAWQNVAAAHRIGKNFKLALGAMKKALPHFKATGDAYRVCNALHLTGEFQWRLGFQKAAWKSFEEMENRGMGMNENKRWNIPFILGITFGRLGDMRQRRRYLMKALGMIPEGETDAVLRVNALINDEHPRSPDDGLHPVLGEILDEAADKIRELSLAGEDQADQTRPGAAGRGSSGRRRARDGEGGT